MNYSTEDKKVLVVDDDIDIISLISLELKRKGFQIECASNIDEALSKLDNEKFFCAFVDIVLGENITSEKIVNHLNNETDCLNYKLPVILMSAHLSDDFEETILTKTDVIFRAIKKPINLEVITDTLETLYSTILLENGVESTNSSKEKEESPDLLEDLVGTLSEIFDESDGVLNKDKTIVHGEENIFEDDFSRVTGEENIEDENKTVVKGFQEDEDKSYSTVSGSEELDEGKATLVKGSKEDSQKEESTIIGNTEENLESMIGEVQSQDEESENKLYSGTTDDLTEDRSVVSGDEGDLGKEDVAYSGKTDDVTEARSVISGAEEDTSNEVAFAGKTDDVTEDRTVISGAEEDHSNEAAYSGSTDKVEDDFNRISGGDAFKDEGGSTRVSGSKEDLGKEEVTVISGSTDEEDPNFASYKGTTDKIGKEGSMELKHLDNASEEDEGPKTLKVMDEVEADWSAPAGKKKSEVTPMEEVEADWSAPAGKKKSEVTPMEEVEADWSAPAGKKKSKEAQPKEVEEPKAEEPKEEKSKVSAPEKAPADVNQRNKNGETPLMLATQKGNIEFIESLLNDGATLDFKNKKGQTAIHYAAKYNNPELIDFLITKGLKISLRDSENRDVLTFAVVSGASESAEHLIKLGARLTNRIDGKSLLMVALEKKDLKMFKTLLGGGVDPELKDPNGKTILDMAKKMRLKPVVQLIQAYQKLNQKKKAS